MLCRMPSQILATALIGDVLLQYRLDPLSQQVALDLLPAALAADTVAPRSGLGDLPYIAAMPGAGNPPARPLAPLVQIKLVGDPYPGAFAQGHTLRDSPTLARFRFLRQQRSLTGKQHCIQTVLSTREGLELIHEATWNEGDLALRMRSRLCNGSGKTETVEMLSSFALGNITPFAADDAPQRLTAHRFRSVWSAEGRLESRTLEDLHLERSWSGAGLFSERFGQIGSMPVRRWFPFAAIEDTVAGVCWGAQLAWAGSWQMEISRQHDDVCLSGGLADREFGQWLTTLLPGAELITPEAIVSCVHGNLDQLCDRLTAMQQAAVERQPAVEQDLPIIFNEWCTTWGDPRHERVITIADRLRGSPVRYLVIDAGWYKSDEANWDNGHGDWQPSPDLFPHGLVATAAAIRERGLIPGLWFEMETVGQNSTAFSLIDHLLQRDGIPLTVRGRRFWDLQDPAAIDYLSTHVIDLLARCGFGYLKVDYNETIGLGCDHADSQGEGLRQQIDGVYRLFRRIRERLPNLVIENCSSGGHRLEPSMLALTAMSSFSDAHELVEIPLIAANLQRLMLPRQSQIWAVLHPGDSPERLVYSLAATFLGRMCLSGGVSELSSAQWQVTLAAQRLYQHIAPVIKHGTSRCFGQRGASWRHPTGWQAVVRQAIDGQRLLIVLHAFAEPPASATLALPDGCWQITSNFPRESQAATISIHTHAQQSLCIPLHGPFTAQILVLDLEPELLTRLGQTKP